MVHLASGVFVSAQFDDTMMNGSCVVAAVGFCRGGGAAPHVLRAAARPRRSRVPSPHVQVVDAAGVAVG